MAITDTPNPASPVAVAAPPSVGYPPKDQQVTTPNAIIHSVSQWIGNTLNWIFGLLSLVVGLSVLATIPILQFLSLGYFLEASARIARTRRIRDGFIGIPKAARIGSIVLGSWLCLLPARLISSLTHSSYLINGDSSEYRTLRRVLIVVLFFTVVHVLWAWFRGGKFRHFLWPAPLRLLKRIRQGHFFADVRDGTCSFIESLNLKHYFWLGFRGFFGALAWLFFPVTFVAMATVLPQPFGGLAGLFGSVLLGAVIMYLPFLQTRFAMQGKLSEMFRARNVRNDFRRAPMAYLLALLMTLAFALPLYLLKAELIPREAAWLPALVFVVFMFPSRIVTGWAVARARKRDEPRHFIVRWSSRFAAVPILIVYVGFVFLTQYVSWHGRWSLYEQHAFLLPVPFLGM